MDAADLNLKTAAKALEARYGPHAPAGPTTPAIETMLAHRSVRAYLPDAVPDEVLAMAVASAQSAATSSNLQAWSLVAVRDPARKARLAELAGGQAHIVEAPLFLVWLIDLNRLRSLAAAREVPSEALDYTEVFLLGAVDASLAAQNAAVALESLGLGTVYIGGMRNQPEAVAELLTLPPGVFAIYGMAVGYPDPARPADIKPRLPQTAVLFDETYDWGPSQMAAVTAYDEVLRDFQAQQNMRPQDWSAQATSRIAGPQTLSGRHVLRAVLARMGFGLK